LKYWQIIRWDATGFLTLHDQTSSRIYYDRDTPAAANTLFNGCRATLGGVVRFVQGFLRSSWRPLPHIPAIGSPYLLLITAGTAKYASEEREIVEACNQQGLGVLRVKPSGDAGLSADGSLSVASCLRPLDYLRALSRWLQELFSSIPLVLTRDAKQRALYSSAIPAIRQFFMYEILGRRIVDDNGLPRLVLSICPGAAPSVALVEHMKKRGVVTAGARTQTTWCNLEHLAINTDILFYKSSFERRAYETLFAGVGPRLEAGCLLSLPEEFRLEPLALPDRYVLLLGTAPRAEWELCDYDRFNRRLFDLAAMARLPAVFKSHNAGEQLDDVWLARSVGRRPECVRVTDIRRNRELIDRAELVASAPSTLLYYAILGGKPVVLFEPKDPRGNGDEFRCAPITRVAWDQDITKDSLPGAEKLQASQAAARAWFDSNYARGTGAGEMIELLLEECA
jgi:hypothetical protein